MAGDNPLISRVRRGLGRAARRTRGGPSPTAEPAPRYGPKPEVVVERTNYGPMMDELVAQVRRNQRALRVNPEYDVVRDHFDHYHFMLQATAIHDQAAQLDPIRVFLRNGAEAVNSPDINFSMRSYLRRHPEHATGPERSPYLEWVKRGRAAGEIADPAPGIEQLAKVLGREPGDIVDLLVERRNDLQHRLRYGKLGEMFAKAAEIDPLVGQAWGETTRPKLLPLGSEIVVDQFSAIYACQEAADFRRARLVLVVNKPRWGGGRRIEGHLAHALAGHIDPGEIVVIYTDESGDTPPGRFPDGVRIIDFAAETEPLATERAGHALVMLLRSFDADAIININSRTLYAALTPYGRALAASDRLFLCFFCNEQTAQGSWEGWSLRHFYRCFDFVEGVITDSQYFKGWLADQYALDEEEIARIHVLQAPVEPDLPVAAAPSADLSRRPQIFWAGRWDRQKRVDIALEVARRMPDVDFRLWGEAVLHRGEIDVVPSNVRLEKPYAHISQVPLSECDAWLYTSAWDGVPSLLLEVAMTEVPIVGSLVGGVGEVIDEMDSWPVADIEEPEAYEKAIREILADPTAAREHARALRARLMGARTQAAYGEAAASLLLDSTKEDS